MLHIPAASFPHHQWLFATELWRNLCYIKIMPIASHFVAMNASFGSRCSSCLRHCAAAVVTEPEIIKYECSDVAFVTTALRLCCISGGVFTSNILCLWEMKKCYLESMSRGISYTK